MGNVRYLVGFCYSQSAGLFCSQTWMQNTQSLNCREVNVSTERRCHALWVMGRWGGYRQQGVGEGRGKKETLSVWREGLWEDPWLRWHPSECSRAQRQEVASHSCVGWDWDTAESEGVKGSHTGKDGFSPLGGRQRSSLTSSGFARVG